MKTLLYILCITLAMPVTLLVQDFTRTDTTKTIYKNLPVLKQYAISSSAMRSADSSWFKINDKFVDSNTYIKFNQFSENANKCKPCILLSFDTSENLLFKRISYGDCTVGYWIEYYPNRKVKVVGHFKENASGNWNNLFERGYCRQDGVWTYFNRRGLITSTEIWKDGKLVKSRLRK